METIGNGENQKENLTKPDIIFATNHALREFVDEFPKVPYNQAEVLRRATVLAADTKRSKGADFNLAALLAEAHVAYAIELTASLENSRIKRDVILTPSETEHFRFIKSVATGNIMAITKPSATSIIAAEYDELFIAGDEGEEIVVPVEVKVGKAGKSRGSSGRKSLNSLLRPGELNRTIDPLREYFPDINSFGFVVIGTREAIGESDARKRAFSERGIPLLSLPLTSEEFQEQAKQLSVQLKNIRPPQGLGS